MKYFLTDVVVPVLTGVGVVAVVVVTAMITTWIRGAL
jgi:hypothetical protein